MQLQWLLLAALWLQWSLVTAVRLKVELTLDPAAQPIKMRLDLPSVLELGQLPADATSQIMQRTSLDSAAELCVTGHSDSYTHVGHCTQRSAVPEPAHAAPAALPADAPGVPAIGSLSDHCKHYPVCTRLAGGQPSRRSRLRQRLESVWRPRILKRVLWLTTRESFEQSVDRWYFIQYDAALQHPQIEPVLWGPGFEGYSDKLPVSENLEARYATKDWFDVLYLGRPFVKGGPDNTLALFGPDKIDNSVKVFFAHEAFTCQRSSATHQSGIAPPHCSPPHGDEVSLLDVSKFDVGLFAYAREIRFFSDASVARLFVSRPHDVSEFVFIPQAKSVDVLLIGSINDVNYPLRTRLHDMVVRKRIPGARLYKPTQLHHGQLRANVQHITVEALEQQVQDYAAAMCSAKIVIVTVSLNNYLLRKYMEAALCGALLIGDVPCEISEQFRNFMVEIKRGDSDEQLLSTIEWWRTHDKEREARAAVGRDFVHRKFRTSAYLTEMLHVSENFLDGQRGIKLNHEIDCIYNGTDNGQSYHVMLPFHPPYLSSKTAFSSLAAVLNDAPSRLITPGEDN